MTKQYNAAVDKLKQAVDLQGQMTTRLRTVAANGWSRLSRWSSQQQGREAQYRFDLALARSGPGESVAGQGPVGHGPDVAARGRKGLRNEILKLLLQV